MNTSGPDRHEARFYSREGDRVRCTLCPHSCLIAEGRTGICGVREVHSGRLYSLIYGLTSSVHPDPIEKKPLYHFLPGSTALSFGSVGCNLSCLHCQNHSISRADPHGTGLNRISAKDVVKMTESSGASSVSWTYNEPTIWHEFTVDASKLVHKAGLKTSYVTNGFIQEAPLRELRGVIDAMNIDVKAFREGFYEEVCGGSLAPVLETCRVAVEMSVHVELTYLIIPDHNDSETELADFCRWVASALGREIPVHFSAFHPDYRLQGVPRTPRSTLDRAYELAHREGLEFVYLGNVNSADRDDTICPKCGTLLIERDGFATRQILLSKGSCPVCSKEINVVL
jgi:pyruvate formate lyase activating enzyme